MEYLEILKYKIGQRGKWYPLQLKKWLQLPTLRCWLKVGPSARNTLTGGQVFTSIDHLLCLSLWQFEVKLCTSNPPC